MINRAGRTMPPAWRIVGRAAAAVLATIVALAAAAPHALAQPDGDAGAGAEVYRNSCAMCHGDDGTGMMGMHPALRGAVERLSADGVEVTIRKGRATTPPMPAFEGRLSDRQIADVIAYIDTLPAGSRNFGPGHVNGMGGGMMDRMMDGSAGWMVVLVIVLAAALAGLIGFLIGSSRSRRP